MASTFIRAFAIMLALTGFGASTYTGSTSVSGPGTIKSNSVTGLPICTSTTGNCGLN